MNTKEVILRLINDSRILHDLLVEEKECLILNKVDELKEVAKDKGLLAISIEKSFTLVKTEIKSKDHAELRTTLIKITDKNMELSNINNSIIGQLLVHNRDLISVLTNSKPTNDGYAQSGKVEPQSTPTNIGKA